MAESEAAIYALHHIALRCDHLQLNHLNQYITPFLPLRPIAFRIKPERDQNNEPWRKQHWWWFGRTHEDLRAATAKASRVIGTTRTAKHRLFSFLGSGVIAESKIVVIGLDDGWHLSALSSRVHEVFSLAAGGWLGVGNDPTYNHTDCFNPFPFPDPTEAQKAHLRHLGEQLDAHRKA